MSSGTIHILTQFVYPDDAPTGLYAEQLASRLWKAGTPVRLVGGSGSYRTRLHPPPPEDLPILHLPHHRGRRGNKASEAVEYVAVTRAFAQYITREVRPGDTVIVTSAPPVTIGLHRTIHHRGARAVFWLQDYYPHLLRGLWSLPGPVWSLVQGAWDIELGRWDRVVKCAGNLGYDHPNAVIIRNGPTLDLGPARPFQPGLCLYTGNFGYGHDHHAFVAVCKELRDRGCSIVAAGDGPGLHKLPRWINRRPACQSADELISAYWSAEFHLVAGHPGIDGGVFPSKIWNAHATGRTVVTTGFGPAMQREWNRARHTTAHERWTAWAQVLGTALEQNG